MNNLVQIATDMRCLIILYHLLFLFPLVIQDMKEVMMTDYRGLTWDPTFLRCWRSSSNPSFGQHISFRYSQVINKVSNKVLVIIPKIWHLTYSNSCDLGTTDHRQLDMTIENVTTVRWLNKAVTLCRIYLSRLWLKGKDAKNLNTLIGFIIGY